ncbi:MAG TPA: hypothetical protein VH682_14400, partial [Gemmataceae bacterium]
RQADLSSVLRENVRQAVERLLEDVSTANKTNTDLFASLVSSPVADAPGSPSLTDAEAHEGLLQATVRVVMRLVVCLFAESRQLLPVDFPIYAQAYGVRSLYELLEETTRNEGGIHGLMNRNMAWPRLMALFRLIHGGSRHGAFPLMAYGGVLFRPGEEMSAEPVARALHILEHAVSVSDATIYHVLRKLLRGPLPVLRGRAKTFVEGPVDYTNLRTEFIGLIYEGLLDYRLKRTDEKIGPQVFLNLGREPVLPLARLNEMLAKDRKDLKDLLTTLRKEKVMASAAAEEEEAEEEVEEPDEGEEETAESEVEFEPVARDEAVRGGDYLDAVESAKAWAKEAVVLAGLVGKQKAKEPDSEYHARIDAEATKLIKKVVATGEFYLVRAGNTRKGTGTFYTRPQLAVPTVHRTLEPLCYDNTDDGAGIPKTPEVILGLKVCDPACGSASFLVAALHYLTNALYKSLCHHRKLDDPEQAKKLTLPYGQPRTGKVDEDLVKFPPNDPHYGDIFEGWVKARLRRHVVERCIYGVDINPLAVEFARVSLWVETLDPELPFSFLDHKIKVGNALVGCWLDRVLDYPLAAWEREGGDGKNGSRTQRIEMFLKGAKAGNRRMGDGVIKQEMRQIIESRYRDPGQRQVDLDLPGLGVTPDKVVADARREYEQLHDLPGYNPDEREQYYREHVLRSRTVRCLKTAMDEWCAVWFWPADAESLPHVPTPRSFHDNAEERAAVVERLAADVKFFHWELAFPDVFTPRRHGFDALIGNPPWDVMKPNSQEFFTDFDPLYRTYDKQTALRRQKELFAQYSGTDTPVCLQVQWDEYNAHFKALGNWARNAAEPFDVVLVRGKEGENLKSVWRRHRQERIGYADARHPFRLQGSADLNSYKMFAEVFWNLLRPGEPGASATGGRLGVILPTGIYSDFGTKDLREELLLRGQLDFLYAFQNEKRVFSAAHHSYKQTVVVATKGGRTQSFRTRFRMGVGDSPEATEIPDDILGNDDAAMIFTPDDVRANSPKTLSLVELKSQRDLDIFRKIYAHSIRIGDNAPGWEISYATEFHMTNDSKHFPPLEKWEAKGYKPDVFGRWIGPDGDVALPLYQGCMIHHFDPAFKAWMTGMGRSAEWRFVPADNKQIRPKYCMSADFFNSQAGSQRGVKIAYRNIARSTDERSLICSVIDAIPSGHSLSVLKPKDISFDHLLFLAAVLQTLSFDYVLRTRLSGSNLSLFILEECPIPRIEDHRQSVREAVSRIIRALAAMSFIHRRFAPEWLRLKHLYPELSQTGVSGLPGREWKHWWAVSEADRLRLRVEIDALCADLYGLDADDFDWIVRDDRSDPKGFYRVDRQLPFRERLTGLSAAALRALKEGKWSPHRGDKPPGSPEMSNDEFFALLGIPEMTTGAEPLIRKRDGCQRWKPEEFGKDDPRHGWTWEHCWQDAVALLGSEKAVREYVEGRAEKPAAETSRVRTDLFGQPLPPEQGKLF